MGVGSWEFGRLEGLIGSFLMSPEGRNVKDSYSLSLEVAAILGLAVIHREFQRHLYPAAHLQLQLLRIPKNRSSVGVSPSSSVVCTCV